MTLLPKEYKPAPRWKRVKGDSAEDYALAGADGKTIAEINLDLRTYVIKTRNRAGGWNYGYAKSLRAAKRKAKQMMREEAT